MVVPRRTRVRLGMRSGLEVVGNFMYPRSASGTLLAMVAAGLLDLDQIPLDVCPLDDLPLR